MLKVAIINGGTALDYTFGLVHGLAKIPGLSIDIVDGDISAHTFDGLNNVHHVNVRGDQNHASPLLVKIFRVIRFYIRLVWYALTSSAQIFHIQWDNKFRVLDRTLIIALYHLCGRKVVFTAHNVDTKSRDGRSKSFIEELAVRNLYSKADQIIVHTQKMAEALVRSYPDAAGKANVVPMGTMNQAELTALTATEARRMLGIPFGSRVILFFGRIDDYKGVDVLFEAFSSLAKRDALVHLIIAGKPKPAWKGAAQFNALLDSLSIRDRVNIVLDFIPTVEVESYFKAADCLVMPYRNIDQSAVLFLAFRFGIPIVATEVGSFPEMIAEAKAGFTCPPSDPQALASTLQKYFESDLFLHQPQAREQIMTFAREQYSWDKIALQTVEVYKKTLPIP